MRGAEHDGHQPGAQQPRGQEHAQVHSLSNNSTGEQLCKNFTIKCWIIQGKMNMQQHLLVFLNVHQYGEEKIILRFFTLCILQFHRMNQFLIKLSKPSHQNAFLATEGTEVAFVFGWH